MSDKPSVTISALVRDIEDARNSLLEVVQGLSPTAAAAPVGEGRWTPTQYVEHLVRAEEATFWRMFGAVEDRRQGREVPESPTPYDTIEEVTARTWVGRVEAPPLAVPDWAGSLAYWTARFRRNAELVRAFSLHVAESELDTVAYNHPISGPFTMRQGMQFIRFHIERHHRHVIEAVAGVSA